MYETENAKYQCDNIATWEIVNKQTPGLLSLTKINTKAPEFRKQIHYKSTKDKCIITQYKCTTIRTQWHSRTVDKQYFRRKMFFLRKYIFTKRYISYLQSVSPRSTCEIDLRGNIDEIARTNIFIASSKRCKSQARSTDFL